MQEKNPIQVTDRLFMVLETLADTGPVTLAALCRQLDLNKSTVHRLLCSLICVGYVKQDAETGKYALSYKLLNLSNKIISKIDILETARPYIKQLAMESGETVHFVQLDGTEAVYIYKQDSCQNSIRMASKVGSRIPLYCSGVGKAILSDMDDDSIKKIWDSSPVHMLTPHTIIDYDEFYQIIQKVRKDGYALDNEENELGVRCIAAGIRDYSGNSRYAFSISAPITRMPDERIAQLAKIVLSAKERLQSELQ